MGRKPNQWARVDEADEIIKKLYEKYPAVLWAVKPECIAVWGIENKEKSEKNKTLAKIKPIKGVEKAILQGASVPTRYVIEIYWSDWREWDSKLKKAVLFHELLHVHPDYEKTIHHDSEDFRIVLDALGIDWANKGEELPDLLDDDVKFNIELRPKVEEYDADENDEISDGIKEEEDEEEKKPAKRGRKPKVKTEEAEDVDVEEDEDESKKAGDDAADKMEGDDGDEEDK